MANGDRTKERVSTAALTIIATLVGALGGQFLDLLKTSRLRQEESRGRAAEVAWTQTAETFQKLFGLQVKLRADLANYREFEIKSRSNAVRLKHGADDREAELYFFYLKLLDEYARRVVEDRTEVQALVGWIDYMLPKRDEALTRATNSIVNLDPWYAQTPPQDVAQLDQWVSEQIQKASESARDEIEGKFKILLDLLRNRRDELLHAPALRYLRQLAETAPQSPRDGDRVEIGKAA